MSDEVTARYLHDLKSKNADVRQSAAISLRRYVHRASSELSAESLVRYMSELHRRIFDLVNSVELCEKLGGVAILDQLIEGTYEENETKIIRFAHYLRMIFQHTYSGTSGGTGSSGSAGSGPAGSGGGGLGGALLGSSGGGGSVGGSDKESLEYRLLQAASAALGHLARVGGTLAADVVEFQVKQSLEWLEGDRSEQRRYAAVLVLKELAENTPTLFNVHVGTFLEHIFHPIRDAKLFIREAAIAALRACLMLISKRALRLRSQRYGQIYAEVINSFKSSTTLPGSPSPSPSSSSSSSGSASASASASAQAAPVESIHGGLLILNELLRNSGEFMLPRYRDTMDLLLRYKDFCLPPRQEKPLAADVSHHTAAFQQAYATHSRIVRDSVVMLLPKMAAFNTEAFLKGGYIEISLAHILAHLRALAQPPGSPVPPSGALHPISREIAFLALGELAILVRERILPELDSIVYLIRDSLTRRMSGAGGVVAREPCSEALTTLASLAAGVGTRLVPYLLPDLIDLVFSQGLSRTLVESLSSLCKFLPTTPIGPADAPTMAKAAAVIGAIQEKLLLSIATILLAVANNPTSSALAPGAGTSAAAGARGVVTTSGAPKVERRGSSLTLAGFLSGPGRAFAPSVFTNSASAAPASDARGGDGSSQFDLLYLSLHTLAVFPFTNHSLLALVRDLHLLSILDYAHPKLRRMAGITCARIIAKTKSATEVQIAQQAVEAARAARAAAAGTSVPAPSILQCTTSLSNPSYSPAQVAAINDVLERLLIAVLTDPDQELRRALLDCLNQGAGADDALDDADDASNDESFEMSGAAGMAWEDDAPSDESSGLLSAARGASALTPPFGALPCRHRLDAFLIASPSFCHSLFMALNDESFAVRRTAMSILGRLALASPGTIMPSLRKALVQLLTEVQHGGDSLQREESAMLLGHLIHSASALMVPYVDTILQVLIPKLRLAMSQSGPGSAQGQQLSAHHSSGAHHHHHHHPADSDHMVSSCILEALGQLSAIGGHILTQSSGAQIGTPAARSYLAELLPILLTILQDKSSRIRKEVALRTLNQLIAATGYAVDPYFRYPALLECLLGLLRSASQSPNAASATLQGGGPSSTSSSSSKSLSALPAASLTSSLFSSRSARRAYSPGYLVRREVIKLLGVLGALDPFVYRQLLADQAAAGSKADTQAAANGGGGSGVGAPEKPGGVAGGVTLMPSLSSSLSQLSDDYYPRMAIQALLRILRDDSLATHHNKVVQAVMFIVKSLGATPSKLARFLPLIVPAFLQEIKRPVFFTSGAQAAGPGVGAGGAVGGGAGAAGLASAGAGAQAGLGAAPGSGDSSLRDSLFIQLGQLISIVRLHIKPYLQAIFELISTGLGGGSNVSSASATGSSSGGSAGNADSAMALLLVGSGGSAAGAAASLASSSAGGGGGGAPAHQSQQAAELWTVHILILIEKIVLALRDDFAVYLPSLLPHMLALLHADHSCEKHITLKILHTFNVINQQYYTSSSSSSSSSSQSSAAANKAGATGGSGGGGGSGGSSGSGGQTQGSLSTDYLYLIIPSFLRLAEHPDSNMLVKQAAVGSLAAIARILNIHEYASRILLPLARMLDTPDIAPAAGGKKEQPSAAAAAAAVGSPSASLIAASLASLTNAAPTKKPPELLALLHPPSLAPLREDILQLLCILAFQFQHNFLHYVPLFQRIFAQPGWVDKNLGLPQALKGETASSATRGPAHIEAFTLCYTHPTSYSALPPVVNSYFERWELIVAKLTAFSKLLPSDLEGVRLGLRAHFGFGLTGLAGAVMQGALTFGIPVHAMGGPAVVAGLGLAGGWTGATGGSSGGTPGAAGAAGTAAGGTKTDAGAGGLAGGATSGGGGGGGNADGTPGGAANALASSDDFGSGGDGFDAESFGGGSSSAMLKKLNVSQPNLKKVWEVSQRSTKDDWIEWMRSFSIELLKESPSPALRACSILAQKYPLLARELFHAAFVSCWSELSDQYQDDLIRCLESCFHAPNLPAELLQILLNLAEFMERDGKTLPIDTRILGSLAQSVHAYAKALHYAESEWIDNPAQTTEALILINNQLGNPEAAIGVLTYTKKKAQHTGLNFGTDELSVTIYEKLNRWEDALEAYERKLIALPFETAAANGAANGGTAAAAGASNAAIDYTLGRMRCLKALGEWERLHTLSEQTWTKLHRNAALQAGASASSPVGSIVLSAEDEQIRREVAPLGAAAAWNLGAWNAMAQYLPGLEEGRAETEILRAVIALQSGDVGASLRCIERTRELLDTELVALMGESYQRAYRVLVQVQQLSELEEIIQIRQAQGRSLQLQGGAAGASSSHALSTASSGGPPPLVRQMWSRRLLGGVARNVEVWQSLLLVRSIVLHPRDDMDTWLKFSSLCRKNGQLALSLKVLTTLLGFDPHNMEPMQETDLAAFATGSSSSAALASPSSSSSSARRTLPLEFPNVTYTYLKHLWAASGDGNLPLKADALLRMQLLIQQLNAYTERGIEAIPELHSQVQAAKPSLSRVASATRPAASASGSSSSSSSSSSSAAAFDPLSSPFHLCNLSAAALARLRSRIYLKMGLWQLSLTSFNEGSSEAKWSEKRNNRSAASFPPSSSSSSASSASFGPTSPQSSSSSVGSSVASGAAVVTSLNDDNIPRILLNFQRATEEIALMDSLLNGTAAPQPSASVAAAPSSSSSSSSSASDPSSSSSSSAEQGSLSAASRPSRPLVVAATASDAITAAVSARRFYKVHHHWAVINYRLVQHYKQKKQEMMDAIKAGQAGVAGASQPLPPPGAPKVPTLDATDPVVIAELARLDRQIASHVIPAVRGFFRSIALAGDSQVSLQDILRLLTLWFGHGMHPEVEAVLSDGFLSGSLSIDTWLPVIPQIIARIDSHHLAIRGLIFSLLCKIGLKHAQALVYPLAVVSKSTSRVRKQSALAVLNSIQLHSSLLVEQSLMVSRELIRVAILWHEMWHEALEEASRLWFGQRNFEGMRATLAPLRRMMDRGASTLREIAFTHAFGRDFQEAFEWEDKYIASGNDSDLNQAWDILVGCFRRINKQLTALSDLELQYVSPTLLHARNLALAMPGTFLADRDCPDHSSVLIAYFIPSLKVIESKQRPRRLSIMGSDGLEYAFLLKGHEDLRQDKRVMQLFGLVNTLLVHDSETGKKDLKIRGYSVIPLAPNSGLISWLHNCDTLHALIKEYRDARCLINGTLVRLAGGGSKPCEAVTTADMLLGAHGLPVRVASVQPNLSRREYWQVHHECQPAPAYAVSANHRLTLVCQSNPRITLSSKPDANGAYSMQAHCMTPDGQWTSPAGYCWSCEVTDAPSAMEADEVDVFDEATLARLALLAEDATLSSHKLPMPALSALGFRKRHRGTRAQLLQEMRSAFFARPRSEYLLAGELFEMMPADLLKAAANLELGGKSPRAAGVCVPEAGAASSSTAAPAPMDNSGLACVTVPHSAELAHEAVAAEARRLDADHTSPAWTSIALGEGQYAPVQYGVDNASIVYMLHHPLSASAPADEDGFGHKSLPFRNLEQWQRELGIDVSRERGIVVTALNPIAALVGEIKSEQERYRLLCERSVDHALAYGTDRLLVFGAAARLRWLQEAETRSSAGAWSDVQVAWEDGVRTLSFVMTQPHRRAVKVFFSVDPSLWAEQRTIVRAMAAAHGVPLKLTSESLATTIGAVQLASPPVSRVQSDVLVTNIEIVGERDQDKRYLIGADGLSLLTHNSVLLNIEHRLMLQMAPDHQLLTLMQKVECFEYALARTTGEDLAKVLWLTAPTSETWLDRRTNYTRSLAVMCIVGYILGLGDRHPCNIMMERHSGKCVHIDFGDCFEVAMQREKFPEKIPFRLTRMLITAMEVSGIEGTFRCTADSVMRVLRENKESVMAVLEAFVYDPLINWRLLATTKKQTMHGDEVTNATAAQAAQAAAAAGAAVDSSTGASATTTTTTTTHTGAAGVGAADGAPSAAGGNPLTTNKGPGGLPLGAEEPDVQLDSDSSEVLNAKAVSVIARVESKLQGRDFDAGTVLDTSEQVEKLIQQATSHTNLCLCYIGWCPFW